MLIGDGVDGVVVATAGPALDAGYRAVVTELTGRPPVVLAADPVGPDRLADAAAAFALVGGPCIVADMGTATTVDVGGRRRASGPAARSPPGWGSPQRRWRPGPIASRRSSWLPRTCAIATDTDAAIRSGAVFGHAALVDGLVARFREELGAELPAVATGGLSAVVAPHCRTISQVDPWLTLRGLAILGALSRRPDHREQRMIHRSAGVQLVGQAGELGRGLPARGERG